MSTVQFDGFSRDTFSFFKELSENNDRKWFDGQRDRYQESILAPAQALVETLGKRLARKNPELCYDSRTNGAGSIFRLHRDTRFSKDKSPYKTNLGMLFWFPGEGNKKENPGFYFHLEATGALMYGGLHCLPRDKLASYREAVTDEASGKKLRAILRKLNRAGLETGGSYYKRVPQGYPADHVHADLLRYNALWVRSEKIPKKTAQSGSELLTRCQKFCQAAAPLNYWLLEHT